MSGLCPRLFLPVVNAAARICCRWSSGGSTRPPTPLGARILTSHDHIFQHNMWDHVKWSEEDEENAKQKAMENSSEPIPMEEQAKFDIEACKYWDTFYAVHQNKFFKDRNWLFREFPELLPGGDEDCLLGPWSSCGVTDKGQQTLVLSGKQDQTVDGEGCCLHEAPDTGDFPGKQAAFRILEVGCGAGNSVFPIIRSIRGTRTFLYCCDFSPRAVQLVKDHPSYDPSLCHAFLHDVCKEDAAFLFPPQSLDVILLVFVMSSIHPARMQGVVNRLTQFLKPGGMFLFRDYGRYDLSQLRFKKGCCLSENFYSRGDGTCVYFFTKEEVRLLFSNAGLEEIQNLQDRRLQVNRREKVAMRRVWMQSKFRKPS
ncbi:tRNA N(3)-cytidine methyltransferase METTL8, mitochondrial isoform X2 [Scleropages formosus]|uniref:tRNA N(3)-cytidine methyltransferase n=3 Tax=Scleropages formosus TaxID=113540 RepID=A0A8C9TH79_SCLFO|nr:methyltransferase-like protein 8 isoform X2 [Scleropages formosus]